MVTESKCEAEFFINISEFLYRIFDIDYIYINTAINVCPGCLKF